MLSALVQKKDDLHFVYERDKSFAAFPTYPVILMFKGTSQDVVDFHSLASSSDAMPPGLPTFDPSRIVHASHSIEILKHIPVESGSGWKVKTRIIGVQEKGPGIIVDHEMTLVDPTGVPYCRMTSAAFNLGAKAMGRFDQSISRGPIARPIPKGRKPDHVITEPTSEEQAIMYRLSGDYNALHVDPSVGQKAGFGGAVLHGLATYGFAARAVLKCFGGDDPLALKSFGVRFTSVSKPGDIMETSMWEVGDRPDGTTEIALLTKNLTTGKVCMGEGVAYVMKPTRSKL